MTKTMKSLIAGATLVAMGALAQPAGAVNVSIYAGFDGGPGGEPYSGLIGSFSSPDINFGTGTGFNWHPFGAGSFGAQMTATINVGSTGIYTFSTTSDDGSDLIIDGSMIVNNGGAHGPGTASGSDFLTAGSHSFVVNFFECCGGASGVDAPLPQGVSFVAAPEPATIALIGAGLTGLGVMRRRRSI